MMEVFIHILSRECEKHLSIKFVRERHCAVAFHLKLPKVSDLDTTLVYILTSGKYSTISKWIASARCLLPAAMLERWLHVCRVKIMFALLPNYSIVSTKTNSMKGFVKLIQVKMLVRSDHTTRCRQVQGGED